ncbi:MAG: nucleotide sugar dehydrogenase [Candidatus Aenigmarchaeota archaeon]|nr:nucleotide sugar dehydrogenase [Candidatus Aenigmarchaeota archaeon]
MTTKIKNKTVKICVVGIGYVGLPTSILFAEKGFHVTGVDLDEEKINKINKGISYLEDLDLQKRLERVIKKGRLEATKDTENAVKKSEVIILTVPTPIKSNKEPDLSFIISAGKNVSKGLRKGQIVILESTVYPGVTEEVLGPILEESGLKMIKDFGLGYCPERYNPGDKKHPIERIDRIFGASDEKTSKMIKKIYQTITKGEVHQVKNIKTAEAAKVIENIQRDLNIALVNEFALIFDRLGVDIMDVLKAASTKWNFIPYYPGPGVGGHCLPVDPYYLTKKAQEKNYQPKIILAGRKVNDYMPYKVVNLIESGLKEISISIKDSKILILGASYKANTGDYRNSPTRTITKKLLDSGAKLTIIDPYVKKKEIFECKLKNHVERDFSEKYDAVVLVVDHKEFKKLNFRKNLSKKIVFVDCRRIYDPEKLGKDYIYRGIGYGTFN